MFVFIQFSRFNFKLALVTLRVIKIDVRLSSFEAENSIADGITHKNG